MSRIQEYKVNNKEEFNKLIDCVHYNRILIIGDDGNELGIINSIDKDKMIIYIEMYDGYQLSNFELFNNLDGQIVAKYKKDQTKYPETNYLLPIKISGIPNKDIKDLDKFILSMVESAMPVNGIMNSKILEDIKKEKNMNEIKKIIIETFRMPLKSPKLYDNTCYMLNNDTIYMISNKFIPDIVEFIKSNEDTTIHLYGDKSTPIGNIYYVSNYFIIVKINTNFMINLESLMVLNNKIVAGLKKNCFNDLEEKKNKIMDETYNKLIKIDNLPINPYIYLDKKADPIGYYKIDLKNKVFTMYYEKIYNINLDDMTIICNNKTCELKLLYRKDPDRIPSMELGSKKIINITKDNPFKNCSSDNISEILNKLFKNNDNALNVYAYNLNNTSCGVSPSKMSILKKLSDNIYQLRSTRVILDSNDYELGIVSNTIVMHMKPGYFENMKVTKVSIKNMYSNNDEINNITNTMVIDNSDPNSVHYIGFIKNISNNKAILCHDKNIEISDNAIIALGYQYNFGIKYNNDNDYIERSFIVGLLENNSCKNDFTNTITNLNSYRDYNDTIKSIFDNIPRCGTLSNPRSLIYLYDSINGILDDSIGYCYFEDNIFESVTDIDTKDYSFGIIDSNFVLKKGIFDTSSLIAVDMTDNIIDHYNEVVNPSIYYNGHYIGYIYNMYKDYCEIIQENKDIELPKYITLMYDNTAESIEILDSSIKKNDLKIDTHESVQINNQNKANVVLFNEYGFKNGDNIQIKSLGCDSNKINNSLNNIKNEMIIANIKIQNDDIDISYDYKSLPFQNLLDVSNFIKSIRNKTNNIIKLDNELFYIDSKDYININIGLNITNNQFKAIEKTLRDTYLKVYKIDKSFVYGYIDFIYQHENICIANMKMNKNIYDQYFNKNNISNGKYIDNGHLCIQTVINAIENRNENINDNQFKNIKKPLQDIYFKVYGIDKYFIYGYIDFIDK